MNLLKIGMKICCDRNIKKKIKEIDDSRIFLNSKIDAYKKYTHKKKYIQKEMFHTEDSM